MSSMHDLVFRPISFRVESLLIYHTELIKRVAQSASPVKVDFAEFRRRGSWVSNLDGTDKSLFRRVGDPAYNKKNIVLLRIL